MGYSDRPLIGYIPAVLKEVREYKALTAGEQSEVFNLFAGIQKALNNQFIETADEYGVKRWESMLNITPKAAETLDERRFTILTRLMEELPYTYRMLEHILDELCGRNGYTLTVNYGGYILTAQVELTAKKNFDDVNALLHRVVPANMEISLSLKYNQQQTLRQFSHGALQAYTQYDLRNEVLT